MIALLGRSTLFSLISLDQILSSFDSACGADFSRIKKIALSRSSLYCPQLRRTYWKHCLSKTSRMSCNNRKLRDWVETRAFWMPHLPAFLQKLQVLQTKMEGVSRASKQKVLCIPVRWLHQAQAMVSLAHNDRKNPRHNCGASLK